MTTLVEALASKPECIKKRHLMWAARTGRLSALMRELTQYTIRTGLPRSLIVESIVEMARIGHHVSISVDTEHDRTRRADEILVTATATLYVDDDPVITGTAYGLCCHHIPGGRNLPVWGVNDWDHEGEWIAIENIADILELGDPHYEIELPKKPEKPEKEPEEPEGPEHF